MQHLDQRDRLKIAIQCRRRTPPGFLDRMDREFDRNPTRVTDTILHALGQFEMVAVAGREV